MKFDGILGVFCGQIQIGLGAVLHVLLFGFLLAMNSAAVSANTVQILLACRLRIVVF